MKEGITTCVPSFCFYTKNSYRQKHVMQHISSKNKNKKFY